MVKTSLLIPLPACPQAPQGPFPNGAPLLLHRGTSSSETSHGILLQQAEPSRLSHPPWIAQR